MSDAYTILNTIGKHTQKGDALYRLGYAVGGSHEHALLRLASNVADRETITITRTLPYGGTKANSFEIVQINTDTGSNSTVLDSTSTANVTETITAHGFTKPSAILRCENEFLQVVEVVDANTVVLSRGYAGSAVASHTDGADIFKAGATALTAGKISLPVGATLTPTAAGPQLATGMSALNELGWTFTYASNFVSGFRLANGVRDAFTETLAGANNAWSFATSKAGVEPWGSYGAVAVRVPTADEVTRGVMDFEFDFTPSYVEVRVVTTAAQNTVLAWDGGITIASGKVSLDNGGAADWATTHTVCVKAYA